MPNTPKVQTKVGTPYKSWSPTEDFDAIVIGSGIGGLTTAALLSKYAGKRVLVLERHYTPGGYTHVFKRPGFEWDVGVHYIGEVQRENSPLRRIFDDLSDGAISWHPMDNVYDRILIGDRSFDLVAGRGRFREALVDQFPHEAAAIDRYIDLVNRCSRSSRNYFGEKALSQLVSTVAGPFMRAPFLRFARRTTLDVLQSLTSDPMLIGVLTGQWGDYGLPPAQSSFAMHAILVRHYLGGGAYPVGGAAEIAAGIAPSIERNGGEILINAEAEEIIVERGAAVGVRMADGRQLRSDLIISNTGYFNTFERLLSPETMRTLHLGHRPAGLEPSMAHINLYVGVGASDEELGLPTTNYWIYPTPNHDANVKAYLEDQRSPLPLVYISFPSAKDPTFPKRYPGKSTIQVISLAPYEWFEQWAELPWHKRGEEYDALKAKLAERLRQKLIEHVPQVADRIEHCELSTPITTRHFANYSRGELYGLAHTPARFQERSLRPRTPVRNLYLTGQDIASAGVGGALFGGVLTASAILKRNMMTAVLEHSAAASGSNSS